MNAKPLVMSELPEREQALIRAAIEDHKATGKTQYSREEMEALDPPMTTPSLLRNARRSIARDYATRG